MNQDIIELCMSSPGVNILFVFPNVVKAKTAFIKCAKQLRGKGKHVEYQKLLKIRMGNESAIRFMTIAGVNKISKKYHRIMIDGVDLNENELKNMLSLLTDEKPEVEPMLCAKVNGSALVIRPDGQINIGGGA